MKAATQRRSDAATHHCDLMWQEETVMKFRKFSKTVFKRAFRLTVDRFKGGIAAICHGFSCWDLFPR